ncbi:hypothetical protein [Saccharopolyspora taberi]|uniref:Uncharacterized protein n=1 Tax=Saccharopolyspora taberi TaxID=60895 RepID=A0ABN3VKV3_9PSEU
MNARTWIAGAVAVAGAIGLGGFVLAEPEPPPVAAPVDREMPWPPPRAKPVERTEPEFRAAIEDLSGYVGSVFPRLVPEATGIRSAVDWQSTLSLPGETGVGINVRYSDAFGPITAVVRVSAPTTVKEPPRRECENDPISTMAPADCRVLPQPDGSALVDVLFKSKDEPMMPPTIRSVEHYRTDGSVVSATAYLYDIHLAEEQVLRSEIALTSGQLTALATDPRLTLAG